MTTTAISGHGGSITTSNSATEITEWRATITVEPLEATSMASGGNREYIAGLTGCTGSFSCVGVIPDHGADATLLLTSSSGGHSITGADPAIIHSVEAGNAVGGVVTYSAQFTMSGAITVGAVA